MRKFSFLIVLFVIVAPMSGTAANVAGDICTQLGKTVMDDNQQNIIACVYNASHQLKWKNMTSSADSACGSGQALVSIVNGVPACGTVAAAAAASTTSTDTSSTSSSGTQCGYASWSITTNGGCNGGTTNLCIVNKNIKCNGTPVLATCADSAYGCPVSSCVFSCPPGYTQADYAPSWSNNDRGCYSSHSTTYSATCVAN